MATRKRVAQFVPMASPKHRAHPSELLGLQSKEIQFVLDAISSGLRWSSVNSFLHDSGYPGGARKISRFASAHSCAAKRQAA
jgi:hypothetical protein